MTKIMPYINLLRPHQYIKNILVFIPMLSSHSFNLETLQTSVLAFISFCLVASSCYIFNDLQDLKADKAHPTKRKRPFASGKIPITHGMPLIFILFCVGIVLAYSLSLHFLLSLIIYFILTIFYSLKIKQIVAIDICLLAGFYTMRIIAGGIATNIELSAWLLAFSIFLFLSLAAVKRQGELVLILKNKSKKIKGRGYIKSDLQVISMICLSAGYISVLILALYINSPDTLLLYSFPLSLWGICLIQLYWLTRIVIIANRGLLNDNPITFALNDSVSQLCLLSVIGLVILGI